ncbi:MAG: HTTM domain-containing protein [Gammaproteobacteria bacterium]
MATRSREVFLFRRIDVRQLALLRIGLGTLIVIYLVELIPLFADQFGPDGWLDSMGNLGLYHAGSWSLFFRSHSEFSAWGIFSFILLAAITFTLGFLTRLSGLIVLLGLISLWNRNPLIMDGDDAILRVMLFYLLLSPCGNALSIDNRSGRRPRSSEIWPLRMIQIQLALVYFVSGWVKFHSPEWLNGTVLETVLIHPEYSRWNWQPLLRLPLTLEVLHAIAWLVMGWEVLFPILMMIPATRGITIATGLIFHGSLLLLMHLRLFSVIMLVLYIAWIPPGAFKKEIDEDI